MLDHFVKIGALLLVLSTSTYADSIPTDLAKKLLVAFTDAVIEKSNSLETILAPEFQIMRANGVGYNRSEYIEKGVKTLSHKPSYKHEDIHVTENDGVLVVRYYLVIDETIDSEPIDKRAPRLTVFRKLNGDWKVTSHANFASPQ